MPRILAPLLLLTLANAARAADAPDLASVARKYRLDIVTANPKFPVKSAHGAIDGAEAGAADLESYSAIFAFEWSLYPPELVKRTRMTRVVFCKNLSFAGQTRTAVPDFDNATLYLDVTRGRHDDRYVRRVIHHEFFHFIDVRDDGKLYQDERWAKLNPPGFKYGNGGAKVQDDPTVTTTGKDEPGFLNRYAISGVEEDKAEVFAYMMVEPKAIAERIEKDKYVRLKTERMTELIAAFAPKADGEWWAAVEKAERPAAKKK
jgi:hypothetical protein